MKQSSVTRVSVVKFSPESGPAPCPPSRDSRLATRKRAVALHPRHAVRSDPGPVGLTPMPEALT
jgi:hypothetical protein